MTDYLDHYNTHRPHRALQQRPPSPVDDAIDADPPPSETVIWLPPCDGLVSEYQSAA